MTTVHEFYEHLDALYEKGDAAGVEAYLTGIANSTYEEGRESDLMLSALNELGSFYRGRSYYEASYAAFMKAKEILDDRGYEYPDFPFQITDRMSNQDIAG